jgi:nitrogen fixation/metabolism regulation signal transduction histidine kinase
MANGTNRGARGPTTIRGRITLGMLLATLLVSPVVVLSLFYSGTMSRAIQRTVDVDIELQRTADHIAVSFLTARRHEKNFIIFGDSLYLSGTREALDNVVQLANRGRRIDPGLAGHFDSIIGDVRSYRALLDTLSLLPSTRPGAAYLDDWNRLRTRHQLLLDLAFSARDSARRDSLLAEADVVSRDLEMPLRGGPMGRMFTTRMRAAEDAIVAQTDAITELVATRVRSSRDRVRSLNAWSQRNTLTMLLIAILVLGWLIVTTPRRLLLPIKRIANALNRAEEGDLDFRIAIRSNDELGQLSRQLNRVFARLREFDERKASRIMLLERRFRLLAGSIAEGVLVVDRTPNVIYANAAMEPVLGVKAGEVTGRALADFKSLEFLHEPLENTLAGAAGRQECEVLADIPGAALCIEALRDNTGTVVGALVIVINPSAPRPEPEPEETGPAPA